MNDDFCFGSKTARGWTDILKRSRKFKTQTCQNWSKKKGEKKNVRNEEIPWVYVHWQEGDAAAWKLPVQLRHFPRLTTSSCSVGVCGNRDRPGGEFGTTQKETDEQTKQKSDADYWTDRDCTGENVHCKQRLDRVALIDMTTWQRSTDRSTCNRLAWLLRSSNGSRTHWQHRVRRNRQSQMRQRQLDLMSPVSFLSPDTLTLLVRPNSALGCHYSQKFDAGCVIDFRANFRRLLFFVVL